MAKAAAAGDVRNELRGTSQLIEESMALCSKVYKRIESSSSAPGKGGDTRSYQNVSTVGLMLKGVFVENIVVDGPAYRTQELSRGDKVVEVDGVEIDEFTIKDALVGNDMPGTTVKVLVEKGGEGGARKVVSIVRMASAALGDRLKLFEAFTMLKDTAVELGQKEFAQMIDSCIDSWSVTAEAQIVREHDLCQSIDDVRNDTLPMLQTLHDYLKRVDFSNLQKAAESSRVQVSQLEEAFNGSRKDLMDLQDAYDKAQGDVEKLKRERDKLQASMDELEGKVAGYELEKRNSASQVQEKTRTMQLLEGKVKVLEGLSDDHQSAIESLTAERDKLAKQLKAERENLSFELEKMRKKAAEEVQERTRTETLLHEKVKLLEELSRKQRSLEDEHMSTVSTVTSLSTEKERREEEIGNLSDSVSRLQRDMKDKEELLSAEIVAERSKSAQLQASQAAMEQKLLQLQEQKTRAETSLQQGREEVDRLKEELGAVKQEKVQLLCDLSESKDDVARLEKVAEDLRKDSQSLATESELDIKGSKTQIEGLMRECESLRQEAALLSKECETCNRNLNAERSSRETAELTLKASQLEEKGLRSKLAEAQDVSSDLAQQLAKANKDLERSDAELQVAKAAVQKRDEAMKDLEKQIAKSREDTSRLIGDVSRLEGVVEELREALDKEKSEKNQTRLMAADTEGREARLKQELATAKDHLQKEIARVAEKEAHLSNQVASNRALVEEIEWLREKDQKLESELIEVRETEKVRISALSEMEKTLRKSRSDVERDHELTMRALISSKQAIERMYCAVFKQAEVAPSPRKLTEEVLLDAEGQKELAALAAAACKEAQEVHSRLTRLEHQNQSLLDKLSEFEEMRMKHERKVKELAASEERAQKAEAQVSALQSKEQALSDSQAALKARLKDMEEARDRLEQHAKSLEKDMSLSNENAKMGLANAIAEIGELRSALAASTDDNARLQHQVDAYHSEKNLFAETEAANARMTSSLLGVTAERRSSVGIILLEEGGQIRIKSLVAGGPASLCAGTVRRGDTIQKVDGEDVTRMSLAAVESKLAGPEGSRVSITCKKTKGHGTYTVILRRSGAAPGAIHVDQATISQRADEACKVAEGLFADKESLEKEVERLKSGLLAKEAECERLQSDLQLALTGADEYNLINRRADRAEKDLRECQEEAASLKEQLREKSLLIQGLQDEADRLNERLVQAEQQLEQQRKTMEEGEVHANRAEEQLSKSQKRTAELENLLKEQVSHLGEEELQIRKLQEALSKAQTQRDEMAAEKEKIAKEAAAEKERLVSEAAAETKKLVSEKEKLVSEAAAEKEKLTSEAAAEKKKITSEAAAEKEKLMSEAASEKKKLAEQLAEAQKVLSSADAELQAEQGKHEESQRQVSEAQKRIVELETELRSVNQDRDALSEQLARAVEEKEVVEEVSAKRQMQLDVQEKETAAMQSDLADHKKKLEDAQFAYSEIEVKKREIEEELKKTKGELDKTLAEKEKLEEDLKQAKSQLSSSLTEHCELEVKRRELEEELKKTKGDLDKTLAEKEKLEQDLSQERSQLSSSLAERDELARKGRQTSEELVKEKKELSQCLTEKNSLQTQLAECQEKLAAVEKELAESKNKTKKTAEELASLRKELEQRSSEKKQLEEELDKVRSALSESLTERAELVAKGRAAGEEIITSKREIDLGSQERADLQKKVKQAQDRAQELERELAQKKAGLHELAVSLKEKHTEFEKSVDSCSSAIKDIESEIKQQDLDKKTLDEAKQRLQEAEKQCAELTTAFEVLKGDANAVSVYVKQVLREQCGVEPSATVDAGQSSEWKTTCVKDVTSVQQELVRLKRAHAETSRDLAASQQSLKDAQAELQGLGEEAKAAQKLESEVAALQTQITNIHAALLGWVDERVGVGIVVRAHGSSILVKSLDVAGSAQQSGKIAIGDQLLEVDGRLVHGMTVKRVEDLALGHSGTAVTFLGKSAKSGKEYTVTLIRGGTALNSDERLMEKETKEAIDAIDTVNGRVKSLRRLAQALQADLEDRTGRLKEEDSKLERVVFPFQSDQDAARTTPKTAAADKDSASDEPYAYEKDWDEFQSFLAASREEFEGLLGGTAKKAETLSERALVAQMGKNDMRKQLDDAQESIVQLRKAATEQVKKFAAERERIKELENEAKQNAQRLNEALAAAKDAEEKLRQSAAEREKARNDLDVAISERQEVASALRECIGAHNDTHEAVCGASKDAVGVGITVTHSSESKTHVVKELDEGGAAKKSGLFKVGDEILSVAGLDVRDKSVEEVKKLTYGPAGTKVTIVAKRGGKGGKGGAVEQYLGVLVRGGKDAGMSFQEQVVEQVRTGRELRDDLEALKKQLAEMEEKVTAAEKRVEEANKGMAEADKKVAAAQEQEREAISAKEMLQVEIQRVRDEKEAADKRAQEADATSLQQRRSLSEKDSAFLAAKGKVRDLEDKIKELNKELADGNASKKEVEDRLKESESAMRKTEKDMQVLVGERQEVASALRECIGAHNDTHEAVCGASKDAVGVGITVTHSSESKTHVVKELDEGGAAKKSGLFKVGDEILSVAGLDVRDKSVEEVKKLTYGPAGTKVTIVAKRGGKGGKGGAVEQYLGVLVRGGKDAGMSFQEQVVEQVRTGRELRDDLEALKKQLAEMEEKVAAAEKNVVESAKEKQALENEKERIEKQFADLEKRFNERFLVERGEAGKVEELLEKVTKERDEAREEVEFMKAKMQQCEEDTRSSTAAKEKALKEKEEMAGEVKESKAREEEMRSKLCATEESKSALIKELAGAKDEISSLYSQLSETKKQLESSEQKRKALGEELRAAREKMAELQKGVNKGLQMEEKANQLQKKVDALVDEKEKMRRKIAQLQQEIVELKKQVERGKVMENRVLQLERNLAKIVEERDRLKRQVEALQQELRELKAKPPLKEGVGLVITDHPPHRVVSVVGGSSAASCGQIEPGDVLVKVGGMDAANMSIADVRKKLKGEPGQSVDITFRRPKKAESDANPERPDSQDNTDAVNQADDVKNGDEKTDEQKNQAKEEEFSVTVVHGLKTSRPQSIGSSKPSGKQTAL